jgi:hypothetical protein
MTGECSRADPFVTRPQMGMITAIEALVEQMHWDAAQARAVFSSLA